MTTRDDDDAEMTDRLDSPGDIALLMHELRELGRVPAPRPSPELETLLSRGIPKFGRRRGPRRIAVVAAVALGAASMTGVAAAADRLPGPFADVVNDLTPLHVDDHHPRPVAPTPTHPSRTSAPDRSMQPRPQSSSDGLESAPPARQPVVPPDAAPPGNSHDDDRPAVPSSPSRSQAPSPSPAWSDDDKRSSPGSQTPSPTQSRTGRDH